MVDILFASNISVIIGIAAGVLTAASMMPQVVKTIKTKKAENVSALMLIILIGGVILWIIYGFLKKDIHPTELHFALQSVMQSGFYYSHYASGKLANLFRKSNGNNMALQKALLNEQEIQFLQYAASDMTYKEIALRMSLNPRSVDSLRDHLFQKLDVRSRVGLAMFAIRKGVVSL